MLFVCTLEAVTSGQKMKCQEKSALRVDKITEALKWLCVNNHRWRKVRLQKMLDALKERAPVVCDRSHEVES